MSELCLKAPYLFDSFPTLRSLEDSPPPAPAPCELMDKETTAIKGRTSHKEWTPLYLSSSVLLSCHAISFQTGRKNLPSLRSPGHTNQRPADNN